MSYATGTLGTFNSRFHQLAITTGDINNFIIEGSGYIGHSGASTSLLVSFNKETQKRAEIVSKSEKYTTSKGISGIFV